MHEKKGIQEQMRRLLSHPMDNVVLTKMIIVILYLLDQVFYNFHIAIQTYFQKIGDPGDIASSIWVSFTINHITAVALPAIGGVLWMIDYRIPFVCGAVFSLISLMAVQKIRTQNQTL